MINVEKEKIKNESLLNRKNEIKNKIIYKKKTNQLKY